jgi:hypothetical protein
MTNNFYSVEYATIHPVAAEAAITLFPVVSGFKWEIDSIHTTVNTLSGGFVRIGGGTNGLSPEIVYKTQSNVNDESDKTWDGQGYNSIATETAVGCAVSGSGVDVKVVVGAHRVRCHT